MKPGDIVTVYANPRDNTHPIDQAILLEKIQDLGIFEQWWFSYLNESVIKHRALFKKPDAINQECIQCGHINEAFCNTCTILSNKWNGQ
jgi:hypothetical protein